MKISISILLLTVWTVFAIRAADRTLPPEAAKALHSSTNTVLYALEGESFHESTNKDAAPYSHKILGQTKLNSEQARIAIKAFEQAITAGNGTTGARCFIPRHALQVTAEGQTYDFLLCYECGWLSAIHKEKAIARVGIAGTPEQLNKLLTAVKIPIPK